MKEAKREYGSNSMDRISELPQGILQRILCLLPQEKAVQTSLLSKSWRYIWCTRPNFHISEKNFKGNKREFLYVVNRTLQRYHDLKLCLDEFRLSISLGNDLYRESVSLLEKWIPTMGVKDFHLSICTEQCVKLPPVVFGAESLHYLCVVGFELDKKAIERIVVCKHLRSLSLEGVSIEDETFQKIMSRCPLIETMRVESCKGLKTIYPHPSLEAITIICGNISFHKGSDFRNLSHLSLLSVKVSLDRLSSCKFPSLKYLKISHCADTQLFIDAPNINHFEYRGIFVPSISFETTSNKWKSFIYLTYRNPTYQHDAPSLWFLKLKKLLESLSQSEISLNFVQIYPNDVIIENVMAQDSGCDKPVVEMLSLCWQSSSTLSLLKGALSICRPRIISESLFGWKKRERVECLWKILMHREIGKEDELSQLWFRDLAEVRMEIDPIDDINREEWQSITLTELQKYKETIYHRFRFVLKWRE